MKERSQSKGTDGHMIVSIDRELLYTGKGVVTGGNRGRRTSGSGHGRRRLSSSGMRWAGHLGMGGVIEDIVVGVASTKLYFSAN